MAVDQRVADLKAEFGAQDADVAWLLCDRHPAESVAFRIIDPAGATTVLTFGDLAAASQRCAHVLASLGVGPGDRVASLMGKSVDLVVTILATWRLGAAYVPLFTAFGSDAVSMRLERSGAKVVVVDASQRHKVDEAASGGIRVVLTGADSEGQAAGPRLPNLMAQAADTPVPRRAIGGQGALVHMFTSGTTGKPKGVVHPVAYLAGWQSYLEYALGVSRADVFWSAADPGWAYGLYTAIAAPMAAGLPSILLAGGFSAELTWRVLAEHGVTNFAAAPTVFRSLRASGVEIPNALPLVKASSAGEPLTPEVNDWAVGALGLLVHDHFGQTEVGMVLANHHHPDAAGPLKVGSMGQACPGWTLTVLDDQSDSEVGVGERGRVAIEVATSPLMAFNGYEEKGKTAERFTGDGRYYLTGDTASIDADGQFFFSSRDDDVIIMAGYRIGPFDVESVLSQHPSVTECCVIAAPDPVRGEVIEAFVVTREGTVENVELVSDLQELVKTRYAAHAYPRRVHFVSELPKTPSGKIQRFVLRQRRSAPEVAGSSL